MRTKTPSHYLHHKSEGQSLKWLEGKERGQKEESRETLMVGATAVSLVSVFEEQEEATKEMH